MSRGFALPSTASSKDPATYPMFRGQITRALWRVYTQRLTPAGRWMLLVSAILIGYGGSSLQIQAYVLASYLILIWLLAIAASLLLRPKMLLDVVLPYRVAAGGTLNATVHLRQRRFVHGGDVSVAPWNLPPSIDAMPPNGVPLPDLRRGQEHSATLGLRFTQRGVQHLKGFRVTSSFPFGMIRSRQTLKIAKSVLVYPAFRPLERIELPPGAGRESSAELIASRLGESFEFLGNREYRQGDNPRDINWRATARMPQPIVREWIEERQVRVSIFLDDCLLKPAIERRLENFERSISMTAAVAEVLLRQGTAIRQLLVGHSSLLEGSAHRPPDLQSILDLLATVTPAFETTALPVPLLQAAERGDVIILVLQSFDDTRQQWLRTLGEITPAMKAIVMHETDQPAAAGVPTNVVDITPNKFVDGIGSI